MWVLVSSTSKVFWWLNKRSKIQFPLTPKKRLVSWTDDKQLLSRVDAIGWNSLKKKKKKQLFLSHFHATQFSSYSFLGRLSQMSLKSSLRGYMYRNHSLLKVAEFLFKFGTQSYYWLFFSFLTQTLTIFLYHNQEKKIIEHFLKINFSLYIH